MKKLALLAVVVAVGAVGAGSRVWGEDWPRFRGPQGDNISRDTKMAEVWPEKAKVAWKVTVGTGYASPVVVDGKLYMFTLVGGKETLSCLDAKDGKELWKQAYDGGWKTSYPGTRASPYVEGDVIYTFGGGGDLMARKLADGAELWRVNVLKETKTGPNQWGAASNPLIVGDLIYVQTGQGGPLAVAVDKKTGKIVHAGPKAGASYASAIAVKVDGAEQIVLFGADKLWGVTPDLQTVIWSEPWATQYAINGSTPIYKDGNLFVTSAYGQGSMMLKLAKDGAKKLWENKDVQARFQGAILDEGYVYVSSEGTIECLKWPEKEVVWKDKDKDDRLGMGGAMVRHGDKLIGLSERGKLLLLEATPKGIKRLAMYGDLMEGQEDWATPLVYEGKVYVKGKEDLVCVDVSK